MSSCRIDADAADSGISRLLTGSLPRWTRGGAGTYQSALILTGAGMWRSRESER